MAKTRAIIRRRKAVQNIYKITRTMELIATARFRRAMDRAINARAYIRRMQGLVQHLRASSGSLAHPLLAVREPAERVLLLVLTANRGLCGGYNTNVLRLAAERYSHLASSASAIELEVSGRRGIAYFRFRGISASRTFRHFEDKVRFEEVEELADRYIDWYSSGRIDRLEVAYTRFHSIGRQEAELATLLPLGAEGELDRAGQEREVPIEFEFLPDPASILADVLPAAFKTRLFQCFLDAAVSEQVARMIAMKGATENASNMIRSLMLKYNRVRQTQITSELAEIVGAAEALK